MLEICVLHISLYLLNQSPSNNFYEDNANTSYIVVAYMCIYAGGKKTPQRSGNIEKERSYQEYKEIKV